MAVKTISTRQLDTTAVPVLSAQGRGLSKRSRVSPWQADMQTHGLFTQGKHSCATMGVGSAFAWRGTMCIQNALAVQVTPKTTLSLFRAFINTQLRQSRDVMRSQPKQRQSAASHAHAERVLQRVPSLIFLLRKSAGRCVRHPNVHNHDTLYRLCGSLEIAHLSSLTLVKTVIEKRRHCALLSLRKGRKRTGRTSDGTCETSSRCIIRRR
jgi:hypothetical protein